MDAYQKNKLCPFHTGLEIVTSTIEMIKARLNLPMHTLNIIGLLPQLYIIHYLFIVTSFYVNLFVPWIICHVC